MRNLTIIELFAIADRDGNYLEISRHKEDSEKMLEEGNNKAATCIIKGFAVFDVDSDCIPSEASEFCYDYEDAEDELKSFLEE